MRRGRVHVHLVAQERSLGSAHGVVDRDEVQVTLGKQGRLEFGSPDARLHWYRTPATRDQRRNGLDGRTLFTWDGDEVERRWTSQ